MPTLHFKGKTSVWNHHLAVPYHTLDPDPALGAAPPVPPPPTGQLALETTPPVAPVLDNLVVEGDNLIALKALLPQYGGRVKCIYIDPPYNTGSENWVYNDNVNSPLISQWLGRTVGRDDLTRHDKWLCMMTPRLRLLRELLAPDGVLFVSIDDYEVGALRLLLDEIFGADQFLAQLVWRRRTSTALADYNMSSDHEYVLAYQRGAFAGFRGHDKTFAGYANPDDDPRGDWTTGDLTVGMGRDQRPNQFYDLTDPATGRVFGANPNRVWAYAPDSMARLLAEGRVLFPDDAARRPMLKRFKNELRSEYNPFSSWLADVGLNTEATRTIQELLGSGAFNYAKPVSLVKELIRQVTSADDIILDSFAGSGTTGQAVMELNRQDGGRRRFVLVQIPWETKEQRDGGTVLARDITAERLRRAIQRDQHPAGFRYARVGQPLDADTLLGGTLPTFEAFGRYCYYLATSHQLAPDAPAPDPATGRVGAAPGAGGRAVYLLYQPDLAALGRLALTLSEAERIGAAEAGRRAVVYAPACFVDDDVLAELHLEFVGIPYQLFERAAA